MQAIKSPQRKSTQYHFCIRITPKVLSKYIFESKGIQSLYKLQIDKGSKKQTSETMRRNLHQQALQGFYRSQTCYFTLANYTNFRPYEMKITFSQMNSFNQQEVIFVYKISTYGIVKNFLQNGVRRSTHVLSKDFQTEFYIDFYVQNNKARLQQKVKYDSNKQILNKKHFKQSNDDEKDSDVYKKSVTSNNSPSKSSHRAVSTYYQMNKVLNTRSSTPLVTESGNKRRNFMDESLNDARSQKLSNSRSKKQGSQNLNLTVNHQKMFLKKYPSTRLSYDDYVKEDEQSINHETPIFSKIQTKKSNKNSKISQNKTIKYERRENKSQSQKQDTKQGCKFDLKVFLNLREISLDDISFKIKKNIIAIIFVSIIFFIVASKALDSIDFSSNKKVVRKQRYVQIEEDEEQVDRRMIRKRRQNKNKIVQRSKRQNIQDDQQQQQQRVQGIKKRRIGKGVRSI